MMSQHAISTRAMPMPAMSSTRAKSPMNMRWTSSSMRNGSLPTTYRFLIPSRYPSSASVRFTLRPSEYPTRPSSVSTLRKVRLRQGVPRTSGVMFLIFMSEVFLSQFAVDQTPDLPDVLVAQFLRQRGVGAALVADGPHEPQDRAGADRRVLPVRRRRIGAAVVDRGADFDARG